MKPQLVYATRVVNKVSTGFIQKSLGLGPRKSLGRRVACDLSRASAVSRARVQISFANKRQWADAFMPTSPWLSRACALVLKAVCFEAPSVEISFLFADDARMALYNHRYLGKNRSTNVYRAG